jgi:hypothetical protein
MGVALNDREEARSEDATRITLAVDQEEHEAPCVLEVMLLELAGR